jgi:hypothetical protein
MNKYSPSKTYGLPENIQVPSTYFSTEKAHKFTLKYDTKILDHSEGIGVRSVITIESNAIPLASIPHKFKK